MIFRSMMMMLMQEHVITCAIQLEQFQLQECVSPTAHFNISHVRESQRSTFTGNCFLELFNLKHKFCNCIVTTGLMTKMQNNLFYGMKQASQIQLILCFFSCFFLPPVENMFFAAQGDSCLLGELFYLLHPSSSPFLR